VAHAQRVVTALLTRVAADTIQAAEATNELFVGMSMRVGKVAVTEVEVTDQRGFIQDARNEMEHREKEIARLRHRDAMLAAARFALQDSEVSMLWIVYRWPAKLRPMLLAAAVKNNELRKAHERSLKARKVALVRRLEAHAERLAALGDDPVMEEGPSREGLGSRTALRRWLAVLHDETAAAAVSVPLSPAQK
jgi:hypothetical protein